MSKKTIVVTGATGKQGGSVIDYFLNLPQWHIRALTRDPSSVSAQALEARRVEVFKADLDDIESLNQAFTGAHAIFLVTDYWGSVSVPSNYALAAEKGTNIRDLAFDIEVQRGKNAATAASDLVVLKTLERFVFSSLADMRRLTNGAMKFKNHFESKGKIEAHLLSTPGLAEKVSTVQLGFYLSNWKSDPIYAPTKLEDGSFVHRTPFNTTVPMPWADVDRDTGRFVHTLVEKAPAGTHMLGVSEYGSFEKWMEVFGKAHGVQAKAEHVPAEEFFKVVPVPDDIREVLIQLTSFMDGYGWTGGDERIKLPREVDSELQTTSIEEYVKREDWSSVL